LRAICGYPASELMGMNYRQYTAPEEVATVHKIFHDVYQTGEAASGYGYQVRHQDGTARFVESSATLMRDTTGQPVGFLGVLRDITTRKEADEALRRSEERYRTIIEGMTEAYWEMDLHGKLTFFNDQLTRLHRRSAEELMGLSYKAYMSKETSQLVFKLYSEMVSMGEPIKTLIHDQFQGDGTLMYVESNSSLIKDLGGKTIGFRGISRDITTRKQAEEALTRSEERYRTIVEDMTEAYWEMDLGGTFTFCNHQLMVEQQRSREELIGLNNKQYMDEATVTRVGKVFKQIYESRESAREVAYEMTKGDGTKYFVESNVSLIRDEEGNPVGFRGVNRDVTVRKQAELELKRAKETAEAASRSKSEFLANMSHEIRTPMNGIIGMTELTLDTDITSEQREYLAMVRSSANGLLTVINDILDFSKVEAGKLDFDEADFSLRECLGNAVRSLAVRAHEKNLELSVDISADVPDSVIGDAGRLRQVIVNLVGNAIKFTQIGEVTVRIEARAITECEIYARMSVADTGIGIPEEKQKVIFDAFIQADGSTTRLYGGTGLGLSISSQLVEMMGGQLEVESIQGEGSTFFFTARLGLQAALATQDVQPAALDLHGLEVLVVDDNATNRGILEKMLVNWQITTSVVDSGPAALTAMELARKAARPFRLVLLDAHMPGMDGFAVAEQIRGTPELIGAAIMMINSNDQHGDAERCRELGVARYITKPVTQSSLLDAIMTALQPSDVKPESSASEPHFAVNGCSDRLHILLAEDNEINQILAVHLLKKPGHTVATAINGKEAIAALDREHFDLVLMDIQMPEMNGFEATALIREKEKGTSSRIPIIALTAHAMKGDRERCMAAGMDGYVSKPIRPEDLFSAIEVAIEAASGTVRAAVEVTPKRVECDYLALLAQVDGDRGLLRDIVSLFIEDYPRVLSEVRDAIARTDGQKLEREAHRLRGSIGNFHAKPAVQSALRLEKMGRSGDMVGAVDALAELEADLDALNLALSAIASEQ
jgi:PAS domain S-box-containing protein